MKKTLIIIITILTVITLSSCSTLVYILEELAETESNNTSDIQLAESEDKVEYALDSPALPDLDYSNMELLEDGYEIVEYRTNPDGDTATFIVSGDPLVTRFLGIDTTEMNYDKNDPDDWHLKH